MQNVTASELEELILISASTLKKPTVPNVVEAIKKAGRKTTSGAVYNAIKNLVRKNKIEIQDWVKEVIRERESGGFVIERKDDSKPANLLVLTEDGEQTLQKGEAIRQSLRQIQDV